MVGRSSVNPLHPSFRPPLRAAVTLCAVLFGAFSCTASAPQEVTVARIVDGDTIQLTDGRSVRYIGINAPEIRRRMGDRWVYDPEPFGEAATEANRRLVEGKRIRLEYDVQTRDRYGRWLAYVYVGDVMVNEELVREGMAQPLTIPPNVRYADRFRALAREARREGRGLWAKR